MGVTIAPEGLRVKTVQSAAGLPEMPSRGDREQVACVEKVRSGRPGRGACAGRASFQNASSRFILVPISRTNSRDRKINSIAPRIQEVFSCRTSRPAITSHAMIQSVARGARRRRDSELRTMLEQRYRELSSQIRGSIRDGLYAGRQGALSSTTATKCQTPPSTAKSILALTQLRAEMLHRVAAALSRLDEGHYGSCTECGRRYPRAATEKRCPSPFAAATVSRRGRKPSD